MLTEARKESLGSMYSLVGTHSAVKLCRWQKSMLRGRGGCYKWTMYGIKSHRCMEATPSMACANKCTFCWRLNTNPTAKEWKWDTDEPEALVEQMLDAHRSLVHNSQGMPGVTKERVAEAKEPRHCALSLVGEPIIYPKINAFVHKLHLSGISSFLVNNGQFPEAIEQLAPVTQLYLSVDGPDKQKMKELDRPVFDDFWERFNRSVDLMRTKKHRTVFRLTMIEGHNMGNEDIPKYQEIFARGNPHFIELKQLTPAFQGRSKSYLRMSNVPTWERILKYGTDLCAGTPYSVASLHEHSKCLLLARNDFRLDGKWHTWIDFDKFNKLVLGIAPEKIDARDYGLLTPDWAVFGSKEEGFDPQQQRPVSPKRKKYLETETK